MERLQEELDSMQSQISSLMLLFEGLSKDEPIKPTEDYDISPHYADHLAGMVNLPLPFFICSIFCSIVLLVFFFPNLISYIVWAPISKYYALYGNIIIFINFNLILI